MRQLYHPKMEDVTVEGILYALGDPVRVRIFMDLAGSECTKNCSNYINVEKAPIAKSTLSQHFRVLREAGLIRSERKGVELQNHTRCAELKEHFGDLVGSIVKAFVEQEKKKKPKKLSSRK